MLSRMTSSVFGMRLSISAAPQANKNAASGSKFNITSCTSKPIVVLSSRDACDIGFNKHMQSTGMSFSLAMCWRASPTVVVGDNSQLMVAPLICLMVTAMALRMEAPINLMATVDVDVDDVVVVAVVILVVASHKPRSS